MKFFLLTFILSFAVAQTAYSQGEFVNYSPRIVTGYYYASGGLSLEAILKNDISLRADLSPSERAEIVTAIKKYNPAVTNWNSIAGNERIYLEIPHDALNPESILLTKKKKKIEVAEPEIPIVEPDIEMMKPEPPKPEVIKPKMVKRPVVKDVIKETFIKDDKAVTYMENKVRYSLILSSSMGTFKETSASGNKITSKQFSPLTLGLGVSVSDPVKLWTLSSSAYVSYLRSQNVPATSAGLTNDSISTPLEIGITAYAQRMIKPEKFSLYAGIDAEKFSTLNLIELEEGRSSTLSNREHMVLYGTVGGNLYLKFKKQAINLRASYSKSVLSSVNVSDVKAYKGWKSIFYVQVPINERLYLNTFFKFHNMTGESELTVTRIGAGIGYLF